ncbi:hypothetical protein FOA52_003736 [Chlamydomonas sp. UWO 241]|nr:hypothetical protein FOA52_003736 [Chlamydomonas sp. UWO 241]
MSPTPALIATCLVVLLAGTARATCPAGQTKTVGGTTINCNCPSTSTCFSEGAFVRSTDLCDAFSTRSCYSDPSCNAAVTCHASCPSGTSGWDFYADGQMCVCQGGNKLSIANGVCSCPDGTGGSLMCYADYQCATATTCNLSASATAASPLLLALMALAALMAVLSL